MSRTTLSSRQFNKDASAAKRAAAEGSVFITDCGRPAHVLLSIEEYWRLTGGGPSVAELLADPAAAEVEFDPPRLADVSRVADLG